MAARVEEAELLQAYQLPTLNPQQWHVTGDAPHGGDGSGEEWHDPLGLRTTLPVGRVEPAQRPQVSIGSKAFDAKAFLNTVHPNASFADLSRGAEQLKASISQRSEALKVLVDENFDRFVSVKATTDGVFREMALAGGPLAPGADLGVASLREPLQQANARADHVFRPVLENYVKVMKLRNTLGVFQRSHFFFNLPGSLNENIRAGHYEAALRDYKKGKYLLESRPGQLLPVQDTGASGAPTEAQLVQQRRIFAKVWDAVEDAMYDMQKRLLAHLREPQHSVEEQEKCIEVLLELDPATDPVAVFLASQHEHIQSRLRAAFEREQGAIDAARLTTDHTGRSAAEQARDLSQCLTLVRTAYGTKPSFARALHAPVWEAIDHMVATLCSTVVQSVPTFWRIARDYAEGRLAKVAPHADTTVHAQAQQWAADSMAQFTTRLYAFFGLAPFAARAQEPLFATLPAWVPDPSCSLSTTHYLSSILGSLTDTLGEFKSLAIPGVTQRLEALVLDVRFQFTEVLCCLWLRDARLCHHLENWAPNSQQPAITSYLFSLSVFNRWNAREGFYIADSRARMQGTPTAHDTQVLAAFSARLKATFVQALYAFLEGIVAAALSPDAGAAWEARAVDASARPTAPDRVRTATDAGHAHSAECLQPVAPAHAHHRGVGEAVRGGLPRVARGRARGTWPTYPATRDHLRKARQGAAARLCAAQGRRRLGRAAPRHPRGRHRLGAPRQADERACVCVPGAATPRRGACTDPRDGAAARLARHFCPGRDHGGRGAQCVRPRAGVQQGRHAPGDARDRVCAPDHVVPRIAKRRAVAQACLRDHQSALHEYERGCR